MAAKNKTYLIVIFFILLMIFMTACGTKTSNKQSQEQKKENSGEQTVTENPIVTITMENDEEIIIELFPDVAPNTVANFISLIDKGFYDGLIFHRVIPGFMIQGGDPEGVGTGGPGYSIKGEFSSNGFENTLKHDRGVISMARSRNPDSAGSQFFIMTGDSPHLDGDYAAFGQVVEGMDTVDEIVSTARDSSDKPLEEQKMKKVAVDTKGNEYSEPKVIN